ncbi:juvenile hormone acid O-methyltransferase [Hyalella azteca]|uniref:Juvenile hormone acid O-methyltransferase n=1 Tax=Hyalella azteca TaxID=294128 RepID=A0A8B7N1F5_HYAAZ|nr:juvenile hormone acid O-methyltransferase [Hyalella azteca]
MDQASLYANANALQRRDAEATLRTFIPRMNWHDERETILDVGCGSGDVTRNLLLPLLPSWVSRVVAVDVSPRMVDFAAKNFAHNIIDFRHLDIEKEENPRQKFPEGFSKIFSLYCLHWVRDQPSCLENLFTLLRPSGEALLVFLAANPLFDVYETLSMDPKWQPYMKDVSNFVPVHQHQKDPAALFARAAEDAGFEVLTCQAPEMKFVFDNINYLKNAVKAVNPFISRMPVEEQEEFLAAVMQLLSEGNNNKQETVARYSLMVAHLQRPE